MDRLEAKRLVRRERCRDDRRQVLCWITPAGLRLLDGLEETVAHAGREALRLLDRAGLDVLVRSLDAIRAAHEDAGSERDRRSRETHRRMKK
jgi:DNA-binding MarR family transcriptional regulator